MRANSLSWDGTRLNSQEWNFCISEVSFKEEINGKDCNLDLNLCLRSKPLDHQIWFGVSQTMMKKWQLQNSSQTWFQYPSSYPYLSFLSLWGFWFLEHSDQCRNFTESSLTGCTPWLIARTFHPLSSYPIPCTNTPWYLTPSTLFPYPWGRIGVHPVLLKILFWRGGAVGRLEEESRGAEFEHNSDQEISGGKWW